MVVVKENEKKQERKPYVRPELSKHGNVEVLTQGKHNYNNGSCPIQYDR